MNRREPLHNSQAVRLAMLPAHYQLPAISSGSQGVGQRLHRSVAFASKIGSKDEGHLLTPDISFSATPVLESLGVTSHDFRNIFSSKTLVFFSQRIN